MAIGAGMYVLGISATLIILLAQLLLHLNFKRDKNVKLKTLTVKGVAEEGYQKYVMQEFKKNNICVHEMSIERQDDDKRDYTFIISMPKEIDEDDVITLAKCKCTIKEKE